MADKPGFVRDVRGTVPAPNAPMNLGMEDAQALNRFGGALADAGDKISNALFRTVGAMNQFHAQEQAAADHLAATEARNLYSQINGELEQRMAANPGEFEQFGDWAAETDQKFRDAASGIVEKMSPKFRAQFEADMQGLRQQSLARRQNVALQAKVTADYNLFQAQWKDAALRGDLNSCDRMLDAQRETGLISQQEYDQKKIDFYRLKDFGEVRRLIDTGDKEIAEKLTARDKDGNYLHFTHLSQGERDRLTRYARNVADEQANQRQMAFLVAAAKNGECMTKDELGAMHDRGEISDEEYRMRLPVVERFWELRRAEAEQKIIADASISGEIPDLKKLEADYADGRISAEDYNRQRAAIEQGQARRAAMEQRRQAEEQRQKNMVLRQWKAQIELSDRPLPDQIARQKAALAQQAAALFPRDDASQLEIMEVFDKHIKDDIFGKTDTGKEVKSELEEIKKEIDQSDPDQIEMWIELTEVARRMLGDGKPYHEIVKQIAELKKMRIEGKIDRFFHPDTGRIINPDTFGKVFDSRKQTQGFYVAPGMVPVPLKNSIPNGWIDKANIAEVFQEPETGRTKWRMNNGVEVYADEYE